MFLFTSEGDAVSPVYIELMARRNHKLFIPCNYEAIYIDLSAFQDIRQLIICYVPNAHLYIYALRTLQTKTKNTYISNSVGAFHYY